MLEGEFITQDGAAAVNLTAQERTLILKMMSAVYRLAEDGELPSLDDLTCEVADAIYNKFLGADRWLMGEVQVGPYRLTRQVDANGETTITVHGLLSGAEIDTDRLAEALHIASLDAGRVLLA